MLKKIAAFVAALVLSATFAVGTFAVSAASDWYEYLYTSSTFTTNSYDGLIFVACNGASATMTIYNSSYKTYYKYLEVTPYNLDDSTGKYYEMASCYGSTSGNSQSITATAKSIAGADYICYVSLLYNTTIPQTGVYRTQIVHVKQLSTDPDPEPWIAFNNA